MTGNRPCLPSPDANRYIPFSLTSQVRVGCCRVLDHLYNESCLLDLMKNLHHPNPKVRMWAVHALDCERCKSCECRPEEHKILPYEIKILLSDSERHVRQMAAGMLGPSVHRSKKVKEAFQKFSQGRSSLL